MEVYEVTQALLSVGSVFHVKKPQEESVLYTVRGELMSSSPKFHLVKGDEGEALADLTANFIKTKYEIRTGDKLLASLVFPAVAFKKTLTLTIGEATYAVDGGVFKGVFQCKAAADGKVLLEIAKELSIRDTFLVKTTDAIPLEIGLLSAVAIHSRFYEMV
jgi:uncharacterized protein YxjI